VKGIDHHFKNASGQQFNLSMQRQLTGRYPSRRLCGFDYAPFVWNDPIDQPTPGPGNIQARRPFNAQYPNVTAIAYYESVGVGSYNSLQTSFSSGYQVGFFSRRIMLGACFG